MADSDDDYDKRNTRDKFRHERSDYERRGARRSREKVVRDRSKHRSRSRERDTGRDSRDTGRDRRSPPRRDTSPSHAKRMRRDDGRPLPRYGPMNGAPPPPWASGPHPPPRPHQGPPPPELDFPTQPPIMSFKHFLSTLENGLSEDETFRRYNDYKVDFKKKQIHEFFLQHKDEEWFRSKYHPEEYDKNHEEMRKVLSQRCDVFTNLMAMKLVDGITVDGDRTANIIKLLDQAVILMEGGTEFDMKCLEKEYLAANPSAYDSSPTKSGLTNTVVSSKESNRDVSVSLQSGSDISDDEDPPKFSEPLKLGSNTSSTNVVQTTPVATGEVKPVLDAVKPTTDAPTDNVVPKRKERRDSDSGQSSASSDEEGETDKKSKQTPDAQTTNSSLDQTAADASNIGAGGSNGMKMDTSTNDDAPQPKCLHQTQSIFLRNLNPTITKQEVEALCKKYPGYIRVALQEPQPERRFARRGWVTFDKFANVKDICTALNNIRLRDCDMGAIVNRELRQRVRPVNGLAVHKQVAKQDIKYAAKIVQNFDSLWGLWQDTNGEKTNPEKMNFGFTSKNPLIKNISDYLVDEGSYEEEALLGRNYDDKPKEANPAIALERDVKLLEVLDRMVLYLRIVYSFDYYCAVEYPNEHDMPHRCGIMYARGTNLSSPIYQSDVDEWIRSFEAKIMPFVNMKVLLDDSDTIPLGRKNQEEEVEKFIVANTQELAKDKWLCPLSGKKFKGPDFIRKHIQTKHTEKIEEVKQEVTYFNNYLKDCRRPQLPEHPSSRQLGVLPPRRADMALPGFHGHPPPFYRHPGPLMYHGPRYGAGPPPPQHQYPEPSRPPPPPPLQQQQQPPQFGRPQPQRFNNKRERTTRHDPRAIISYTDLDAPVDDDIF